jgi:DNA-binding NtrC family response regulator
MSTSSRFEIVPLSQVPLESKSLGEAQHPPIVLVVDDEKVIADTLSIILSRHGFLVQTAYDAESALDLARVIPPQLLLSDVMMGPGRDGMQLALEVMKSHPDCKVILFSGHAATQELMEKARDSGHTFTLLSKPLHPADLLDSICGCFGYLPTAANA